MINCFHTLLSTSSPSTSVQMACDASLRRLQTDYVVGRCSLTP